MSTSTYGASFVARLDERLHGAAIGPDHPDYDGGGGGTTSPSITDRR